MYINEMTELTISHTSCMLVDVFCEIINVMLRNQMGRKPT